MLLITGGAGYIGSHVNKLLHQQGYDTLVFDNLVYGHRCFVKWGTFVEGDLSDRVALESLFSHYKIDAVLHFAAYAYVGESVEQPAKYYRNNVVGTLNLLDVMLSRGVRDIVFSSSCTTYGDVVSVPIVEEVSQQPVNPYGCSKYMIEQILADYGRAYGLRSCVLRYFNAAGADPDAEIGEWHEPETHLIPLVLETALGKRHSVSIYGSDHPTADGTCIRDYIHVADLADAHLRALQYLWRELRSDTFNLANGCGHSVLEVVEAVRSVTGKLVPIEFTAPRPGDPSILVGSAAKAKRLLGWQPKFALDAIIATAWQWQKTLQVLQSKRIGI